jgi:hypothetical protein
VLSEYRYGVSVRFYAAIMMIVGALGVATSAWSSHRGRLTGPAAGGERIGVFDGVAVPAVFGLSILISFWSVNAAMLSWLLIFPASRVVRSFQR